MKNTLIQIYEIPNNEENEIKEMIKKHEMPAGTRIVKIMDKTYMIEKIKIKKNKIRRK